MKVERIEYIHKIFPDSQLSLLLEMMDEVFCDLLLDAFADGMPTSRYYLTKELVKIWIKYNAPKINNFLNGFNSGTNAIKALRFMTENSEDGFKNKTPDCVYKLLFELNEMLIKYHRSDIDKVEKNDIFYHVSNLLNIGCYVDDDKKLKIYQFGPVSFSKNVYDPSYGDTFRKICGKDWNITLNKKKYYPTFGYCGFEEDQIEADIVDWIIDEWKLVMEYPTNSIGASEYGVWSEKGLYGRSFIELKNRFIQRVEKENDALLNILKLRHVNYDEFLEFMMIGYFEYLEYNDHASIFETLYEFTNINDFIKYEGDSADSFYEHYMKPEVKKQWQDLKQQLNELKIQEKEMEKTFGKNIVYTPKKTPQEWKDLQKKKNEIYGEIEKLTSLVEWVWSYSLKLHFCVKSKFAYKYTPKSGIEKTHYKTFLENDFVKVLMFPDEFDD